MKIAKIDIQNFRRLKSCRIDFSEKETVFVGANNSGKTTAMDALILFFKNKTKFTTRDFTLSNWNHLNSIGESWVTAAKKEDIDLSIQKWEDYLPSIDIWLDVNRNEIHYVKHLIPTLEWAGGDLGVRLRYEPTNLDELYKEFTSTFNNSKSLSQRSNSKDRTAEKELNLWPKDMWDFIDKSPTKFFSIKTYLLDPTKNESTQKLTIDNLPIEANAFDGLIKIDIINAQRGFSDVNSEGEESNKKNLSSQLRSYYDKHLNPSDNPTENDLDALHAIQEAKELFDKNLKTSFAPSLSELESLNYPGFGNPQISLSCKLESVETLNHNSAVLYNLSGQNGGLSLPEKYNGLGYQNLISMIFKLIRFRDEWMQVGKSYNNSAENADEFEPLHLVLIEEPEAHLHAQVQQVFIREAYRILRQHEQLAENTKFTTQLVISTHSNHIAHEIEFTSLRYFKREQPTPGSVNTSKVVNLSETFGSTDDSTKFAIRYLKTTHCDLFFADAIILVEGPAERMLLPYFIKKNHKRLNSCYISILEIGGSHAHTLKPLIENLGIITLIITDLDSVDPTSNNKKTQPDKGKGYKTGNDTLKTWIPSKDNLDEVLVLESAKKVSVSFPIRVAYQIPLKYGDGTIEIYPYTFEDSLVMENRSLFKGFSSGTGLLKEMIAASKESDDSTAALNMYEAITKKGAKKAEFALELFFLDEPDVLTTPQYISEGLVWLESQLIAKKDGLTYKTEPVL